MVTLYQCSKYHLGPVSICLLKRNISVLAYFNILFRDYYIYIYIYCKVHTCRLATKNNCNSLELALSRLNYIRWYFIKTNQVQNSGRLKNAEKRQLKDCILTAAWQVENHLSWLIELHVFTDWDIGKVGKQLIFSTVGSRVWGNSCTYK